MGEAIANPPKPAPSTAQPAEAIPTNDDNGEIIEEEQPTPEDAQEFDQNADQKLPKPESNPFNKPSIDNIIEREFNDDLWRLLKGGLPCLETSAVCLEQLQTRAITQSPLLKEIDTRIAEANERIAEAKKRNKKSIQLAVLTPALQYLLGPAPAAGQPQTPGTGLIDNLAGIFSGKTSLINGLLNVIGIPLFQGFQGGNADAQRNAIAISDIQVKVAELQRSRAQLADTVRGKVAESLVKFDEARVEYQTAQIVTSRATDQFKVFEARYTQGNSDTETYLSRQNQLDNQKAQTYRAWAKMRRSLFELKLLVLSVKEAEI
ncbi:TolC family protein [Nostoc sp. 2RC]|uniref:TolC family protein n=1 Tax=Nostoc sp. 2RC TaxID=2485484 RepID=UPI001627265A|nr:TolC family protein [Nostoc sp. 2RC]MBC1237578.1 TolC family protein [Nostoc sp. 2RC]